MPNDVVATEKMPSPLTPTLATTKRSHSTSSTSSKNSLSEQPMADKTKHNKKKLKEPKPNEHAGIPSRTPPSTRETESEEDTSTAALALQQIFEPAKPVTKNLNLDIFITLSG